MVPAATAPAARASRSAAVPTVQVAATVPALLDGRQHHAQALRLQVVITNPGPDPLTGISVRLERGSPISQERLLQAALSVPPPTGDVEQPPVPVPGIVTAGQRRTITVASSTGGDGLCLSSCSGNSGIYPVDAVLVSSSSGEALARAHTYVPSFDAAPDPVQVSWVWPLIDRPHRRLAEAVFTDDELAASVASGGRLDRALRVVELVAPRMRMTLLVDPELIDALTVMTSGYHVTSGGRSRLGTGGPAARAWLARLRVTAARHDVALTAYADPDVDALARSGQTWSPVLAPSMAARVDAVLGSNPISDVSWPVGGAVSPAGLDSIVGNGASTVLLTDQALSLQATTGVTPDAVSPLPSAAGQATAVVLSSVLQKTVAAVTSARPSTSAVALLDAQLAVRAAESPGPNRYVVLAPDRYVDPEPATVSAAIEGVAAARWARPITVRDAVLTVSPVDRGGLVAASGGVPAGQLASLARVRARVASFRDCLQDLDAARLLSGYPAAIARGESAAWRRDRAGGLAYTNALRADLSSLVDGVRLTQPPNASYTLASNSSPLFIIVENRLTVAVRVRLQIRTTPGQQGLHIGSVPAVTLPPASLTAPIRRQIKVPTRVDRTGRFRITVALTTPRGAPISAAVPFRVRSTAIGAVALWITGGAFG
ncbi:MAG: hypothetical protein M3140_08120, partial [Actinomycetota bacterium]|nr:hypothetical protein [Actinomycetota bacterium]